MLRVLLLAGSARRLLREQRGQALIEYGLLIFLLSIAAVLFLIAIGVDITETFDEIENALGFDDPEAPPLPGDDDTTL
jgi:Flp pilus assembly pilin Flp